jgi:hypothetical protein
VKIIVSISYGPSRRIITSVEKDWGLDQVYDFIKKVLDLLD